MEDPEYVDDDRNPFEELKELPTTFVSIHSMHEFEVGLNELKEVQGAMREYSKKYTKYEKPKE